MAQRPQPPPLLFTFAFYIGAAAFAVVLAASMVAGAGTDAAVLRGVQAFLAFLFVGWVAETIVQATPAPRAKAQPSAAAEGDGARSVAAMDEAAAEPAMTMAGARAEATETDHALSAVADLPTAEELMADDPLSILRDDDDTADGNEADGDQDEGEDADDQAELAA